MSSYIVHSSSVEGRRNEALHKKLSVEVLHLILCEEKAQFTSENEQLFFSFWVITSPEIAQSS